ncbi:MAG: LysM peptidoglycan-binding domain-containing protein [Planctomycetota bacterium]|nr:MAG: LysM peptidoglycan-binding domain-containing protein [Planctomycetota bacterium]
MSVAAKEMTIASVIMVGCIGLLAVAFTTPTGGGGDSSGDSLALATSEPSSPRSERPAVPRSAPQTPSTTAPERRVSSPETRPSTPPTTLTRDDVLPPVERAAAPDRGPVLLEREDILAGPARLTSPSTADSQRRDSWLGDADARAAAWAQAAEEADQGGVASARDWQPGESSRPTDRSPETAAPARRGPRTHVVVSGETYQSISSQYYGTTRQWQRIQAANNADQHALMPGMTLIIPELDDEPSVAARPSPREQAPVAAPSAARTYVVQRGDSYYTIARDQLGNAQRYRELAELNGIDPYDLQVGMTIRLPAAAQEARPSVSPRPGTAAAGVPEGAVVHVVQRGEILGDISQHYYGTSRRWRVIADANGITDPGSLQVGQRLIIPDAGQRQATVPAARSSASTGGSGTRDAERRGEGVWHEVARGDTLQAISQRYFGTTTRHPQIAAANPGIDPNRLVVGARIWVPEAAGAKGSPQTPTRSAETPARETAPAPRPERESRASDGPDWGSVLP